MTCGRIKDAGGMTLFESKETLGTVHGWAPSQNELFRTVDGRRVRKTEAEVLADQIAEEKRIVLPSLDGAFICGDFDVCACGCVAEILCDYPMGRGKTCDIALCESCAREVGDDRHLCLLHWAEFKGKAKIDRVNPWPPKRGDSDV